MTGLLTFTHADNYGALLQAYALQQILKKMGHESLFLNFDPGKEPLARDLSKLPPVMRKKIEETLNFQKIRTEHFADFRRNYLSVSEKLNIEDAEKLNGRFERFIVGSDQVWNAGITGGNLLYSLTFADPQKRYSYAASFGGSEGISKAPARFWQELSKFQKISLREETGLDFCKNKTGISPFVHVDPTLLMTKEDWLDFIQGKEKIPEKYLFLFLIEYDAAFFQKAKDFADAHGLPLHIVTASYFPQFGFESFSGTGVQEWLRLIRDAEYVFCDSFHALVFSILFGKRFMPNLSKAKLAGRSSRLIQLIEKFKFKADEINENNDPALIEEPLQNERKKAFCYLGEIYD